MTPNMKARAALCTGVALGLAVAVAACGRFRDKSAQTAGTDRVVCVSKQLNEFMYAIGAEQHLVAVDLTSIYPPQIKKLPTVGYHRALSAEGIISMRPTLFLTDGNVGPSAVLDQLKKVGIPIETMLPGNTLDSAQQLLLRLGDKFGRRATADSVLAQWKAGMQDVWRDTARYAGKARPRVLIIHFGQIANNYLAVKAGGPADDMIRWAGGVNAVDSVGGMERLSPELIAKIAPDIIVATDLGFDRYGSADAFATMPGVSLTPAGKAKRIYRITETELLYFGPRTPTTVRKLRTMFRT